MRLPVVPLSPGDVQRLFEERIPEGDQLDYKAQWWAKGGPHWEARHECAKDVSGLANAYGGHLILGIAEDVTSQPGRSLPGSFTGLTGLVNPRDTVKNWLGAALLPRELGRAVRVDDFEAAGNRVVVVTVPPLTDGVAVVETGNSAQRLGYHAPIRDGDDTRWMDWTEVEKRMAGSTRKVYLQAVAALTDGSGRNASRTVQVVSPIRFFQPKGEVVVPVPEGGHAQVLEFDEQSLTLGMVVSRTFESMAVQQRLTGYAMVQHDLVIPWSRVRDLWMQPVSGVPRVFLLLDVAIRCEYGRYMLSSAV